MDQESLVEYSSLIHSFPPLDEWSERKQTDVILYKFV